VTYATTPSPTQKGNHKEKLHGILHLIDNDLL